MSSPTVLTPLSRPVSPDQGLNNTTHLFLQKSRVYQHHGRCHGAPPKRQIIYIPRVRRSHPTPPATVDLPAADHTAPHWPPLNSQPVGAQSPVAVLCFGVQLHRFRPDTPPKISDTAAVVLLLSAKAQKVAVEEIAQLKAHENQQCTAGSPARNRSYTDNQ